MKRYVPTFILFLSCIVFSAKGQNGDIRAFYEVNVNHKDFKERAEVYSGNQNIHVRRNKLYYWYTSNKILSTVGGFDGKLLHGQYCSFYLNNNLKEKGQYRKGLKVSEWIEWYSDGNIKSVTKWKNGMKNGQLIRYNEKGSVVLVESYKNDIPHGSFTFYENGEAKVEKQFKNGIEITPKKTKQKKSAEDLKTKSAKKVKGKKDSSKKTKPLRTKLAQLFSKKNKEEGIKQGPSEKPVDNSKK